MPEPRANERKEDFINRCVEYVVENEGVKPEQAVAMCYSIWDESKKNKKWVTCQYCKHTFDYLKIPESGMGYVKCPKCNKAINQEGRGNRKSIMIKILNHSIYNSEPTLLLNDILINASLSKKVKTRNILLTHSHQVNLEGLNNIESGNIYLNKYHEHFLKHHIGNVEDRFELNYVETFTSFSIDDLEIYPILTKHLVQEIYKEECLGYIINKRVAILTPCYKIPKKSMEHLKDIEVLIIDGGYRTKALYQDHKSILDTLKEFKGHSNLKHIYFLGTHRDYKITGKIRGTSISVDTLFTGDILKIK